jgi:hypothetical protein
MKMAKATEQDIDAAGKAMAVLQTIASRYYPGREGEEDAPTFFDADNPDHLRRFYEEVNATLDASPGWPGRVIGGMCYVILYPVNQIVAPDSDCLELHPRFAGSAGAVDGGAEYLSWARVPVVEAPDNKERPRIDANALERMAKERPDECFLKGSGVLKLIGAIRQLEGELRALRSPDGAQACIPAPEFQEATWGVDATMRPCKSMAISKYAFREWAEANGIALTDGAKESGNAPR